MFAPGTVGCSADETVARRVRVVCVGESEPLENAFARARGNVEGWTGESPASS